MNTLDLFAGPGGWDVGAQALGIDPLGIEYDDAACATREAAGLRTIKGDVSALDPREVMPGVCDLLIASPPCQAWSMAGSRQGEHDREEVYALARRWGHGPGDDWADERSPLAAEPMRWVDALEPSLIAFEQVPPVIDLWRLCASLLAERGYAVWTGILSAERYGVPQTRKRAILMASKIGGVHPPMPTHLPYVAGEPKPTEPMLTLEGELLPWVSMAEALGWGDGTVETANFTAKQRDLDGRRTKAGSVPYERETDAPAPTLDTRVGTGWRVGFPRLADAGEATEDGYRERDFRDGDEPAFALTEKARSTIKLKTSQGEGQIERYGERQHREADEPAVTLSEKMRSHEWVDGRPATTGHKGTADEGDKYGGPQMRDAVRVTVEEASILQSFPPDYPWQGSRTKQFQQIGNAVPPLMAKAILEALIA